MLIFLALHHGEKIFSISIYKYNFLVYDMFSVMTDWVAYDI